MSKKFKLIFPCNFDWDSGETLGTQKHCETCDKTIKDYTNSDDDSILSELKNNCNTICGRFRQDQLAFNSTSYTIQNLRPLTLSILTLLGLTTENNVQAQTPTPSSTIQANKTSRLKYPLKLTGHLKDSIRQEPLSFAFVTLFQKEKRICTVQTNNLGDFTITLQKGDIEEDTLSLCVNDCKQVPERKYPFVIDSSLKNNSIIHLNLLVNPDLDPLIDPMTGYIVPIIDETPNPTESKKTKRTKKK